MDRRFRIIGISVDIVASYGKDFEKALLEKLGPGTQIMLKETDFYTATLFVLIYHPEYQKLASKTGVPSMPFAMEPRIASPIIQYSH